MAPAASGSFFARRTRSEAEPSLSGRHINDLQRDQLGAAEHGVIGDGQDRAVPHVDDPIAGGRQQAPAKRPGQPLHLRLPAPPAAGTCA